MLSKNESLKNATEDDFKITFINKNQSFAIARVNPEIHKKITKAGRVYIDLWSNKVSNHYQPLQCFKCQAFNHTSTSPLCPLHEKSNETICLYCALQPPKSVNRVFSLAIFDDLMTCIQGLGSRRTTFSSSGRSLLSFSRNWL